MSTPEVSVVIPTRDRRDLLFGHALPSALGQVGVEIEVIVVDDGSTDGTVEALSQVDDPRFRVLRNKRARGVSGARNTGIWASRGEWLAFLDDDDMWSPNKIRTQLDGVGGARWGFASVIVVDESLDPLYLLPLPESQSVADALVFGNIVGGPSTVIAETALVRRLGGFDEGLSHSADWDLWLRLVREETPAVCRQVLVAALEHPRRMMIRDRPDIRGETRTLFEKHGGPSRRRQLAVAEWLAAEHRSAGSHLRAALVYGRAGIRHRSPGNLAAAAGALFGERGLRAVSRLLVRARGVTHIEHALPPPIDPDWLQEFRAGRLLQL